MNIETKNKKKARLLDMFLSDTITEEQFTSHSAEIDKDEFGNKPIFLQNSTAVIS